MFSTQNNSLFDNLPAELMPPILSFLKHRELCPINTVNQQFSFYAGDEQIWQKSGNFNGK